MGQLKTGVVSQTGFGNNISGHMGVVYNNTILKAADAGSGVYKYYKRGAQTFIWY